MKHLGLTVVIAPVLFAACSTAPRHSIEKETLSPDWQGKPRTNLLVIGAYEDRGFRIGTESVLASELSAKAVAATPSYDLIPEIGSLDSEEAVGRALDGADYDGILLLATIEAGPDFDYDEWHAQYAFVRLLGSEGTFTRLGGAIDSYESGRFILDISLWDANTLKLIWQADTDSYTQEEHSQQVATFADFVIAEMRDRGLI